MAKTPTMADIVDLANAVAQQGKAANQINQFAGQAAVQIAPQAKQKAVAPLVKEKIQQLPDEVKKYHQSIDNWQKENLQRLKDSTELSDDEKTQAEAALWQETQKYKQEAVKKRIAYNEDRSQNPNINQLDVAKSNLALRKQGGWKAQTDEQKRYEANIEDSDMLGLGSMGVLSGVENFGKSALTVIPGLMDLTSQRQYENEIAARNRVAPQQNNIDDIARLMAENEASKAQIGKIQQNNQQRKAFMDKPTAFEQLYENEVGKAVAQGAKDTKTFQSGEFTGKEVLPFLAAPGSRFLEGAGIAGRVGLGVEKGLAKLGVSSGVAKALGKIGSQVVTGAEDFASQEVLPAAIQEGSKLATGEQTGGQALGNIGKRVATAGAIGAVGAPLLETGLPYVAGKVGQGIAKAVEPLQRGNQYKQVLAERAGVQAERAARNADIEQVQTALRDMEARDQLGLQPGTKIEQKAIKQDVKRANELQKTINQAEDRVYKQSLDERLGKVPPTEPVLPTKKAQSTEQIKIAQTDLKNQYSEVLNNETAISEKPVRDGLEELGFEVKTNAKGEKFAQLGNVKVSLKDMPPPYSLSGLKSSLKERIASAKAAKDIQVGKVSDIEGIQSEFLNDAEASKYLDQLDEKSLYEEKQFVDSIKNAQSPQELEAIAAKQPDLFNYDEKGNPSKYMKEYEAREAQLSAPKVDMGIPASENNLIQRPELQDGLTKERGLTKTINENPSIAPETKGLLEDTTYKVRNTKELFERATERVEKQDPGELYTEILTKGSQKGGKWTDEEVATGYELARKFEEAGDYQKAAAIEDALSRKATEGGQMIQAYAKYGKTTPEGAIREANKVLENSLPPAKAKQLREATDNLIKDFNKANKKAIEDILNFCPPGSFE